MRAVAQDEYGTPEVLELRDIHVPTPGPGEVLVKVRAAGVDMSVWHLMTGKPLMARAALGFGAPRQKVRGAEVSGTVEAIGAEVTRFTPGDEVFGVGEGSFAEYAIAKERMLVARPATLDPVSAAALPISAVTALQAVRDRLAPGQRVLVLGAGGGVGHYVVQLAAAEGATVTGVCSAGKADLVRSLGAATVTDYRNETVTGEYDLVVDTAGQRSWSVLRSLLAPGGTAVIVGGEGSGTALLGGFSRSIFAGLGSRRGRRIVGLVSLTTIADLERVGELAAAGTINPAIDGVYPLERAAEAVARMAAGGIAAKAVVVP